jgi:hypothetical protein
MARPGERLPCPHCGAPMPFRLRDYTPYHRVFRCSHCAQTSLLPLRSRLIGIAVPIVVSGVEMAFLRLANLIPTATTSLGRVFIFLLLFVGAVFVAVYCSLRACRRTAGRLIKTV